MGFFSKWIKKWDTSKPEPPKDQQKQELSQQEQAPRETASSPVQQAPAPEKISSDTTEQPPLSAEPKPPSVEPQTARPDWQKATELALSQAEPRLSIWLTHVLDGVKSKGDDLWQRLRFLFHCLEVEESEAEDFIRRFDSWLNDMDYELVEEFRSELQYRLALALELEDEEDERDRLFLKLSEGISKTRKQLSLRIDQLLNMNSRFDDEFWEEFEEILIMADVGYGAAQKLQQRLRQKVKEQGLPDSEGFKELLRQELGTLFPAQAEPPVIQGPEIILVVGVNGVGKTTTIAKLAHREVMRGRKVLLAAGDTFRAAAIEQLEIWSKRIGTGFYAKPHGSDPAAVAYEALEIATKEAYDCVFIDTAGRLQTKVGLMEELSKIFRVIQKKNPDAPHRTLLVLDATTGQNALSQTELFSKVAPVNEIVLTKLDGTAKGGVVVGIALQYAIPISFIGLGEKMEDLRPFSGTDFANALLE